MDSNITFILYNMSLGINYFFKPFALLKNGAYYLRHWGLNEHLAHLAQCSA